jgi:colanic acid/amylovoran biosynthesis glycosyltransferase
VKSISGVDAVTDGTWQGGELPDVKVGYIMTHYPRVAQTFIANEIDAVESCGLDVRCFAMNEPNAADMLAPDATVKHARTLYLKAHPVALLIASLAVIVRHPMRTARVLGQLISSTGGQLRLVPRRLAHLAQAAVVARECEKSGITHLHAHFGLATATVAWFASGLAAIDGRSVSFSYTIHGFHDFVDERDSCLAMKAQYAKFVLCISDFTRSQLCLISQPDLWSKYHVARCGIDLAAIQFVKRPDCEGPLNVLALGRLSPEKGFAILLDAIAELRLRGVNIKLSLVGDGPQRTTLEARSKSAHLSEHVTFVGELPPIGVRRELERSDIFCLPSFSEGLPVSIMEAMAAGVPVVTTWIAGIPELAISGETALTVPPGRVDALVAALERLAKEPQLGQKLAVAARRKVEQLHDLQQCGKQVAELLKSAAA